MRRAFSIPEQKRGLSYRDAAAQSESLTMTEVESLRQEVKALRELVDALRDQVAMLQTAPVYPVPYPTPMPYWPQPYNPFGTPIICGTAGGVCATSPDSGSYIVS